MREDYAWDGSGPPDPFVERMQSVRREFDLRPPAEEGTALAQRALAEQALPEPAASSKRPVFWIAAAAALLAGLLSLASPQGESEVPRALHRAFVVSPPVPADSPEPPADPKPPETEDQPPEPAVSEHEAPSPPPSTKKRSPKRRRKAALVASMSCALGAACKPDKTTPPTEPAEEVAPPQTPAPHEAGAPPGVAAGMHRQQHEIQACVDKGRKAAPDQHGKLTLRFLITTEGQVAWAKIDPGPNAPAVRDCIVTAVEKWTFPGIDEIHPSGLRMVVPVELDPST